MKKHFITALFCLGLLSNGWAQQSGMGLVEPELTPIEKLEQKSEMLETAIATLQKFKVSGYIQAQYQLAQPDADGTNFKLAKGINSYEKAEANDFGRFGVRRGRIKFTYEDGIASGVVQIDVTDKGISSDRNVVTFKDVYLNIKDPWYGTNSFKAGIFDRPFGHEIAYSSSRRESPERSRIVQSLFPDERDLGAMITLQPEKNSAWNILKLEAGLFAGNGIKPQFDSHMDFIGHLSVTKTIGSDMSISGGVSAYLGGVFCDSTVFVMKDNQFELDQEHRLYSKRQYIGFDLQYSLMTTAGLTTLRGEYIFGENPGTSNEAYGFKYMDLPAKAPAYMRSISGGYILLTQDLGATPFTFVAKYDWYNPNTKISGDDITKAGDITRSNIGLGLLWRINPALRLTAYYDVVKNEKSANLKGYETDRKDNVFTLRLQYKF